MKTLMPRNDRVLTIDEAEAELRGALGALKHVMGATIAGLDAKDMQRWKQLGNTFAETYAGALGLMMFAKDRGVAK